MVHSGSAAGGAVSTRLSCARWRGERRRASPSSRVGSRRLSAGIISRSSGSRLTSDRKSSSKGTIRLSVTVRTKRTPSRRRARASRKADRRMRHFAMRTAAAAARRTARLVPWRWRSGGTIATKIPTRSQCGKSEFRAQLIGPVPPIRTAYLPDGLRCPRDPSPAARFWPCSWRRERVPEFVQKALHLPNGIRTNGRGCNGIIWHGFGPTATGFPAIIAARRRTRNGVR